MIREPSVAGTFYPGTKDNLEKELCALIQPDKVKRKVFGLISPHAGYIYSGACAGKGYSSVIVPSIVVVLGVNHRGYGHPFAVDGHDYWKTPIGNVPLDKDLREKLVEGSKIFKIDSEAGLMEHSLEVQVPFIQYDNPKVKILPITISSMDLNKLMEGGREIASLLKDNDDVLVIASTDMSHYIDADSAKEEDQKAIDEISRLDPKGLFNIVVERRISMCGMSSTVMMLSYALTRGATKSEIIEYTNSGVVSGDFNQVVGYLSMIVS
jgi:AmmeMemoRadiSam system protein B